ncbi:MAG: hypothetical protein IPG86_10605 [Chitinophagaceae bacterium]|nr:hypothetical protein [Chitinophagaceae bacterium]
MDGMVLLIFLILLYWLIPISLLIVGLVRIKSSPENAKKLLIMAGILFLVGAGICGALLS